MTARDQFGVPSLAAALPLPEVIAILASDARSSLDMASATGDVQSGTARQLWLGFAAVATAVGSLSLLLVLPVA